jgi:hypothetical protein
MRSSIGGVACTIGSPAVKTGVALAGVLATAGEGATAASGAVGVTLGGTTTVCASSGVALKARTAAIAALAGRVKRVFFVIAKDQQSI